MFVAPAFWVACSLRGNMAGYWGKGRVGLFLWNAGVRGCMGGGLEGKEDEW